VGKPGITPPVRFEYLRYLPSSSGKGAGVEVPAAGSFEGWPDKTAEVTTLDPCMGSGHFVVSLFLVMVKLRMFEENLTAEEATDLVITENLNGLEIDSRCTQLAAFNLALTAWRFCGRYRKLPEMNLACSGIAPKGKMEDWLKLVGKVERADDKARMENGMKILYQHFQLAPELGSLLDPTTIKADAFTARFEELQPVLKKALENEVNNEEVERGVLAAGIAKAGQLLSRKYLLIITNPPYLGLPKMAETLKKYCTSNYINAKYDLSNIFLENYFDKLFKGGSISFIMPQNWLFLKRYMKYRKYLLKIRSLNILAFLGPSSFRTIMWDFNVQAIICSNYNPKDNFISIIDSSNERNIVNIENNLKYNPILRVNQINQLGNPDSTIGISIFGDSKLLSEYSTSVQGLATSDNNAFIFFLWEIENINSDWEFIQSVANGEELYSGLSNVIHWEQGKGRYFKHAMALKEIGKLGGWKSGSNAWNKNGISVSQMGQMPASLFLGTKFDVSCFSVIPNDITYLPTLWCYLSSDSYREELRKTHKGLVVTNSAAIKVPFDIDYWQKVALEKYPNGLPKPYSDDPTQWLFHGHPVKSDYPLQVAVARLLGYQWPAETDTQMELSDEARQLIKEVEPLNAFADDDGIVCIPSVNGEPAAADRLRELLKTAYDSDWSNFTIEELLKQTGTNTTSLETWLRESFFEQHFKLFQHRPFIWHIWDGRKDGFSVLVNYHKLTKEALEKIIFRYLGDWIHQCEARKNESGAEGLLMAAKELKKKLEAILEGESPYDIFVRWKPMHQQPIGWNPDLNDGVRMNIRPFIEAGVLRKRPNIKWDKDRGKNPPNSPWGEDRINDTHLSLAQKREALEIWKRAQQNLSKPAQSPNPLLPPTIE